MSWEVQLLLHFKTLIHPRSWQMGYFSVYTCVTEALLQQRTQKTNQNKWTKSIHWTKPHIWHSFNPMTCTSPLNWNLFLLAVWHTKPAEKPRTMAAFYPVLQNPLKCVWRRNGVRITPKTGLFIIFFHTCTKLLWLTCFAFLPMKLVRSLASNM